MPVERIACLAMHLAGKFLTDRTRRQLDAAGNFSNLARVLLAQKCTTALDVAGRWLLPGQFPDIATQVDADYPPLLAEIDHAPFAFFLRGNRAILAEKLVSIVGTREPSDKGRSASAAVSAAYVRSGHAIVSGIARGVDSIAHHAALGAGGRTIAVLPNGFNHAYPLENRDLYETAATSDKLLLISEYPPDQKPQKHHFVRRNRLIAGLSEMTIFVEGDTRSGAMITVNHALKEGRDVAAFRHPQLLNNAGGEQLCADGAIDLSAQFFAS